MNFKRKRARKQTVGCPCCHIPKNNSAERTKPKDREIGSDEWIDEMGLSVERVAVSRVELENGNWVYLDDLGAIVPTDEELAIQRRANKITNYPGNND